ncbi:hypothetical protein MIND_01347600 [Mycena indigotica]|uniref:Uncharacterized protein n=1 Tax=Mycena indigotica TaxID=2126181 RepID=A0A8H6S015_9AGAR|nr:uncharacterized protein MIND_01347600 [Mycena indigotica]KAF7289740.1 hypothetical protein MIND_01347600 [Mycena indigotica]
MKRPLSVGDLQLGERYINMDFMFLRSLTGTELISLFVSYDIACQWHVNLWDRMSRYDHQLLSIDKDNKYFVFLVPKFHLPAHIEECNIRFSFNLTRSVGMTDGEAPERVWAATNPLAGSTMNMGPGSRRDALDDFFNDQNHKKIINLGRSFLDKVKEAAPLVIETKQAYVDLETSFAPETVAKWTQMVTLWESGATTQPNPHPNPFESQSNDTFLAGVRHQLAEEVAAREAAGTESIGSVREDMHVTELIAGGLQLEEQQSVICEFYPPDMLALKSHATDRQRTLVVERASKLRRKILAWTDIQAQFFPVVDCLRQEEDDARADIAAGQSQAIPGIGVTQINLWLPSAIQRRIRGSCSQEIITYEFRLRVGQANEALNTIRRLLLIRTHLYNQKDRYSRGVKANTRSNTKIAGLEERVRRAAAMYHAAWDALNVLGDSLGNSDWQTSLKELKADDLRGIPRAQFGDPARQRTGPSGTSGRSSVEAEVSLDRQASQRSAGPAPGPSQTKRRRMGAVGAPKLSWIWVQQTVSRKEGDPEHTDEALRIEWARTRARALRWSEELDLLEEEMRRVQQFLLWRADWWEMRAEIDGVAADSDALEELEGKAAYARQQAQFQRDLCGSFARMWGHLPAYILEARNRAASLTSEDLESEAGAVRDDNVENGADTPVPLGPTGAILTLENE